jgi:hypothetical protein
LGQEYFINSQALEDKIRESLPSQGGAGAGFDLSASTQIIPVIDVTETAEGSVLRQDLQLAQDSAVKETSITNATNTVIETTTGFWKVIVSIVTEFGGNNNAEINIFDGTTSKPIFGRDSVISGTGSTATVFEFNAFLRAGDSLRGTFATNGNMKVYTRQIASIDGTLTNPLGF